MRISDKSGFIIMISFMIVAYLIVRQNDKRRIEYLYKNGIYSIATITNFKPRDSRPSKITYTYRINSVTYTDSYSSRIPVHAREGKSYFLLVDSATFNRTMICLDCPINTESDYDFYVEKFNMRRE